MQPAPTDICLLEADQNVAKKTLHNAVNSNLLYIIIIICVNRGHNSLQLIAYVTWFVTWDLGAYSETLPSRKCNYPNLTLLHLSCLFSKI